MIAGEIVRFGISKHVLDRLLDMAKLQSSELDFLVHQCVAAGDLVRNVHLKGLMLCAEDEALKFPEPQPRRLHRARTLEIKMHPDAFLAFERLRQGYGLDKYSALYWCMVCYQVIEEARILSQLFSQGPGRSKGHRPLWPDLLA